MPKGKRKPVEDRYVQLVEKVIRLAEKVVEEGPKERKELMGIILGTAQHSPSTERPIPSDEELWRREVKSRGLDPDTIADQIDNDTTWDARTGSPQKREEVVNGRSPEHGPEQDSGNP